MKRIRLELPVAATPGRLTEPRLGIVAIRTSLRTTSPPPLTLLDTADLRLTDAGIVLAHRVVDGLGEWVFASNGWQPHLPGEVVQPFGHGDLPDEFSALTTPFRRRAPLGVRGRLTSVVRTFTAVDAVGTALATISDEESSVELGERSAESAEVSEGCESEPQMFRVTTVTPLAGSEEQVSYLVSTLEAAGGAQLADDPALPGLLRSRYGTGDYRYADRITAEMPMGEFVRAVLKRRLRRIIEADLAFRRATFPTLARRELANSPAWRDRLGADTGAPPRGVLERSGERSHERALARALRQTLQTIEGVAWATTADTDSLIGNMRAILEHPAGSPFGERYLTVLDELVWFSRSPRLGAWSERPASAVMTQQIDSALVAIVNRARRLDRHSPPQRWERTKASALRCLNLTRVSRRFLGSRGKGLRRRLRMIVNELDACVPKTPRSPNLEGMGSAEAFEAGREFERAVLGSLAARVEFVASWPDHQADLKQLEIK